jgi:diguanylate cyclase (GGDEF)-like protein
MRGTFDFTLAQDADAVAVLGEVREVEVDGEGPGDLFGTVQGPARDQFGHGVGDQALVAVAQVLDSLQGAEHRHGARWGGEEFFWLLPGLRLSEACRRAEELRRRIAALELPISNLKLSVSIGVAEYLAGEPLEDCLRRCDAALYRAKDSGRNTVVAARGNMFATMS